MIRISAETGLAALPIGFGNVALVAGAAALAIPVIIHLFHKSRFQTVKWGAMHLLEAVIRTNRRRVRLEQIILLLVRAAIPLLLALCMAQPIWKGARQLLGEAKTSAVVLLDSSYSMAGGRAGAPNISIAREEAAEILGGLQPGSEAQVVAMGGGGGPLLDEPTYDLARLTQAVQKVEARLGTARLSEALDSAAAAFGQMREPVRNLVVLTDFQRVSFAQSEDAQVAQMIDRLKTLPNPPEITFLDVGSEFRDNVAVESLEFSRLMVGVGQKVQIRANLRNYGETPYPDLRVYFKVDGKEKSVAQIRLGTREKGQVLFSQAFDTPGSHFVEVLADADALKEDNSYLASIPVRGKVPVLLVNGAPATEPLKGETDFAEIALQPYGAARVELADLIATKVVRAEELNAQVMTDSAVVVLANVPSLTESQRRALDDFVRKGGGILVFPGDRCDPAWYNSALFQDGNGMLPLALGDTVGEAAEAAPAMGIVSTRFEHPALEIFNDPRNGTLSEAGIRRWFRLRESASAENVTPLARLENGDVFLAEKSYGAGRVIECATPLDADWSNLPMRPFYLPLLQRLSVYLASTVFPPRNLDVGKPLVAFLPVAESGQKAAVIRPDGSAAEVNIVKQGERGVVEFSQTQQPGLYTLNPPGGGQIHFAVNTSRGESDGQKLTEQEIGEFAARHQVTVVRSAEEYRHLDQTRRHGWEFWSWLLWALLGLIFLELFLQQRFGRVRGGAATAVPARKASLR